MAPTLASTGVTIILRTQDDWDDWIEIIRALAEALDIWTYLDPENQLVLVEPVQPSPSTVAKRQIVYSQLDQDQIYQLTIDREQYSRQQKQFDRKELAIKQFRIELVNRISASNLGTIAAAKDTPECMIRLYKRFAPTADFRRKEIIGRYTKLRDNKPDVYDIGLWLGKWEKVFADGVKAGLSDVEGKRPFEDFVCVASSVTPGFSEYWRNRLMDGIPDGMDFYSLIQRFREFQSQARFDTISHGVFTATLNGRDADGNSMDRKTSPCLCRENHRYSDCPYLCEAVRSPD